MNRLKYLLLLLVCSACYYDKYNALYPNYGSTGCDTTASYNANVKTVLNNYCTSCHFTGTTIGGGIALDNYANAKASGQAILDAMTGNGVEPMPKTGTGIPLSQTDSCSVHIIRLWIQKGYPN